MAELIPFPLNARAVLVQSMADDLEVVHGAAANMFWRERIARVVNDMQSSGLANAAIRAEILNLHEAIQAEMRQRAGKRLSSQA